MSGGSYPLSFAVQYSNYASYYSVMGWGWSYSFNQRLYETDQNRIFIRDGHGRKRIFQRSAVGSSTAGTYIAVSNSLDTLTINGDGSYTMHLVNSHEEWNFDSKGRLISMANESGGEWRISYTSDDKESVEVVPVRSNVDRPLVVIRDWKVSEIKEYQGGQSTGRFYSLGYDGTSGLLKTVTNHDNDVVTLVHDFNSTNNYGLLNRIEAPGGALDEYTYKTDVRRYDTTFGMVETLSNTGCNVCTLRTNVYDSEGRVRRQYQGLNSKNPEGEDITFNYASINATNPFVEVTYAIKNITPNGSGSFIGVTVDTRRERVYFTINPYTNRKRVSRKIIQRGGAWDNINNLVDDYLVSEYEYNTAADGFGEVTKKTTANGLVRNFTYSYHQNGTLSSKVETREIGNGVTQTITTAYNDDNHKTSQTTTQSDRPAEEFVTEYTYWAGTELLKESKRQLSAGNFLTTTKYYYNVGNGPNSSSEHTGLLAKETTPLGNYKTYTYTTTQLSGGNVTRPGGLIASMASYDAADTSASSPLAISFYTYNAFGNKTSANVNGIITNYEYDARERLVREYQPAADGSILTEKIQIWGGTNLVEVRTGNPEYGYRAMRYGYDTINNQISTERLNSLLTNATDEAPESNWEMYEERVYDNLGNVRIMTNALGQSTNYDYDQNSWLLSTTVPVSKGLFSETSYSYDNAGRQVSKTAPNGTVTAYQYDNLDRNIVTQIAYDANTDTAYRTDVSKYDALDNRVVMQVFEGSATTGTPYRQTNYYYDRLSRKVGVNWNPETGDQSGDLQLPRKYEYDADSRMTIQTDGEGRQSSYSYDGLNRVTDTTYAPGTADEATMSASYNLQGNVWRETDGRGISQYAHFDELARPTHRSIETRDVWNDTAWTTQEPNVWSEVVTYSPWHEARESINVDRVTSTTNYDSFGRMIQLVAPATASPVYTYTALDKVATVTYPPIDGNPESQMTYVYDSANGSLIRETIDRAGNTTSVTYNESILSSQTVSSLNHPDGAASSYEYDFLNRVIRSTNEVGDVTVTAYDVLNNVTTVYHPDHPYAAGEPDLASSTGVEKFGYDNYNQVTQHIGTGTYPIQYSYDLVGNMLSMRDNKNQGTGNQFSGGTVTQWQYDNRNRMVRKFYDYRSDSDFGNDMQYTYNENSALASRRDGNGVVTSYIYEPSRNLLQQVDFPTDTDYTYVNDKAGRRTSMTDATGACSMVYDSLGRLETYTQNSVGQSIHYNFDEWSRIVERRVRATGAAEDSPDEWLTQYSYDVAGRLKNLTDDRVNTTTPFTYTWNNNASLVDQISFPSGARQNKAYDELGRITQMAAFNQANTQINNYSYTYNSVGQRQDVTLLDGSKIDYTYDQLRQLNTAKKTDATSIPVANYDYDYNFDVMGNRTNVFNAGSELVSYTPNALNQYSLIDPATGTSHSPSYDGNGSLLSDGRISNTWNEDNRLKVIIDQTKGTRSEYLYDGQGRRIERNDYNTTTGGTAVATMRYLYEGWNCVADYEVQGGAIILQKSYTWGLDLSGFSQGAGGVGGLLAITNNVSGVSHEVTYDGNGNVSDLLNVAGTVTAHYEYDPFGNIIAQSGSFAAENTYRFSTKPMNLHTGELYYYGYRYYDPVTGRWPSRDPIGERGGINLYGMVGNNPISRIDLLGLFSGGGGAYWPYRGNPNYPGYGEPRNPPQAEIDKCKGMCDGYPNPAPKCCDNTGKMVEDNYPPRAINICKDFIQKYKASKRVKSVARCLINAEKGCQKKKKCSERNSCRLNVHVKCYAVNLFVEPFAPGNPGFPDGGAELGWRELLPDWIRENVPPPFIKGPPIIIYGF